MPCSRVRGSHRRAEASTKLIEELVGIHFDMEDGSTVKVAVPYIYWQQFGNEFALAMVSAAELCEAAYAPPKGRA